MQPKNLFYILLCLSFSLICGAAVYEHVVVWPNAFASLPRSLSAFQGEYALNSAPFWMMIHPVTMVLFIIALIVSWRTERKKHVLYSLIVYVVILATTFTWFVPELLDLVNTPYSDTYDASLTSRGSRWETLSIIRGIVLFVTAIFLYMGLTKPAVKHAAA